MGDLRVILLAALATMSVAVRGEESVIPMPGVEGRIDHLAFDPARHRLFVAALGNGTLEAIDTGSAARRSVRGFDEPQGVAFVPEANRLFVAEGGGNRVDVLDASTLEVMRRMERLDDADNVRYDALSRSVWVGYGGGALAELDAASGEVKGHIDLPGHPESFQLERNGPRAFVNVPSARKVVVVDRARHQVTASWDVPDARQNFPMALDESGRRLFVGARSPAVMLVYDIDSGRIVARLPIGGDTDDLFFDAARKRVYAVCGEGRIDVIEQQSPDRYSAGEPIRTAAGARTGLFVSDERVLYIAAPAMAGNQARILAYRLR